MNPKLFIGKKGRYILMNLNNTVKAKCLRENRPLVNLLAVLLLL
jgi:hypothetical protein